MMINPYIFAVYEYLYDTVAFQGGFSLWKLNDTYTGYCIRVRRTSDNVEQEIGFSGNFLDIATLLSFIGASNGRVVKWYSQEASGLFASQSTGSAQPIIVASGVMVTNPEGNYALDFGTASLLYFSSGAMYNNKSFAMGVSVTSDITINQRRDTFSWQKSTSSNARFSTQRNFDAGTLNKTMLRTSRLDADAVTVLTTTTNFTTGEMLRTDIMDWANADSYIRENGVQVATSVSHGTAGSTSATDSNVGSGTSNFSGIGRANTSTPIKYISEVIFYNTDVIANVTDIESNVNTRHNVY